jgi:hypothetical protein
VCDLPPGISAEVRVIRIEQGYTSMYAPEPLPSFTLGGLKRGAAQEAQMEEVHTLKAKDKAITHSQILHRFRAMVPAQCQVIIVTDADFRVPWIEQVQALNWDWVSRVRNRNWVELNGDGWWLYCNSLHDKATATPRALGEAKLTWKHAWSCRLVLY